MHVRDVTENHNNAGACRPFKKALKSHPGGYKAEVFAPRIEEAIQRAKASDTNPDHFMPEIPGTKLYLLAEQMLEYLGQDWERAERN